MLPFSTIDFFLLFGGLLLLAVAVKIFLSKYIPYKILLLVVASFYLTIFYPEFRNLCLFILYGYLMYYLLEYVLKLSYKMLGVLLLAAPMVFAKVHVFSDVIAFGGLSYVTFRLIQMYVDNDKAAKPVALIDYVLFLVFPATLLIGPIDRLNRFKANIDKGYENMDFASIIAGWQIMLYGILQKYIVAEAIDRYWLANANEYNKDMFSILNNMYGYSIYLYFDFAGYSALAIGLAKMFGINVPDNFNNPFLALNPSDFWRRWQITLGDWLKDYVFKPYYKWVSSMKNLKKYPLMRQNSGLFLTFFVMGLWNGHRWYYILSGCLFGVYSVVHNTYVYYSAKKGRDIAFGSLSPKLVRVLSVFIMFNMSCLALYVFSGRMHFLF